MGIVEKVEHGQAEDGFAAPFRIVAARGACK